MRLRIVIAIVGSVVVTLALFALPLGWVIAQSYRDQLRLQLVGAALAAAPELAETAASLKPAEPPPQRRTIEVAYYDAQGRFVSGRGPSVADATIVAALRGANVVADGAVAVPVSRGDRVVGVVRAAEGRAILTHRIHRAWWLMAALALAVIVAVAALATALVRRLTKPVHALAEAARRLESGDFAVAPETSGIDELDSAGLALAAAAQRLEGVLARERALTADVTHQLRTPLTALRLELEAGAERSGGPDAGIALAEVDRLESTISAILALARDNDLARLPIAVDGVLEAARRDWVRPFTTAGRVLRVLIEPSDLTARISGRALRQIVDVLLDNALRHGSGRVDVRAIAVATDVRVDVTDGGQQTLDATAIFARRSASARGHGIGLALARSLAEAEGGRLALAADGGPTTFALLLRGSPSEGAAP